MHWDAFKQDNYNTYTVGGDEDVGSARYEPALLPTCPTTRVLTYSNCHRSAHSISKLIFKYLALYELMLQNSVFQLFSAEGRAQDLAITTIKMEVPSQPGTLTQTDNAHVSIQGCPIYISIQLCPTCIIYK